MSDDAKSFVCGFATGVVISLIGMFTAFLIHVL